MALEQLRRYALGESGVVAINEGWKEIKLLNPA